MEIQHEKFSAPKSKSLECVETHWKHIPLEKNLQLIRLNNLANCSFLNLI